MNDSFNTFSDIQKLQVDDIKSLADSFSKRAPMGTRIIFGQRRTKKLKSLIQWSQDFRRCSCPVTIDGLDQDQFTTAIETASMRAEIRQSQINKS